MDLKVPAVDGSQWTAAERQREEKSLCGNDLQTLLDFCGSPQNDAVERVKGKKPYTKFIQQKQQLTKLCAQKMGKKVWVECVGGLYARSDEVVYQTSAYWH